MDYLDVLQTSRMRINQTRAEIDSGKMCVELSYKAIAETKDLITAQDERYGPIGVEAVAPFDWFKAPAQANRPSRLNRAF